MSRRPHLVVVSPLPPSWSGIATYTAHLLPRLAERWQVTVMVADGEPAPDTVPDGVQVIHARSWAWFRRVADVDRILWMLGNSSFHLHVPDLVRRHGGVVLAHDVRMTGLQCLLAHRTHDPHWLSTLVTARHGRGLGTEIRALEGDGPFAAAFARVRGRLEEANTFLLREAVDGADALAVHSHLAARLARLDIDGRVPVHVVPFGHQPTRPRRVPAGPVVASFGFVAPEKHAALLVEAMARVRARVPGAELRFVGHVDPPMAAELDALTARTGMADRVTVTGRLDDGEYGREIDRTAVAVQLRAIVNGEASAAIADCLSAGLPTVVTDNGAQAELPDDAVVKVAPGADAAALADHLVRLLTHPDATAALTVGAQRHASASSFARAADALSEVLLDAPPPRG